jgi:hypothetical protein
VSERGTGVWEDTADVSINPLPVCGNSATWDFNENCEKEREKEELSRGTSLEVDMPSSSTPSAGCVLPSVRRNKEGKR